MSEATLTENPSPAAPVAPRRPGPKRRPGSPVGPDEVRTAVLDAAERLFAARGVEAVPLRDIAAEADVQMALIWRYLGKRDDLVEAVFRRLSDRLVQEIVDRPLEPLGFERDTVMGRWLVMLASYVLRGAVVPALDPNPVLVLAETLAEGYGLDAEAAHVRAAQITGSGLGWRLFEGYLIEAAGLEHLPVAELRSDLSTLHRRAGATPWPTPEPERRDGPAADDR